MDEGSWSAGEATPPRGAGRGHAQASAPAVRATDGERDLLAGERVWEAAWGAWATARATTEGRGAGG